jgi:two-component system OmpR family sensor kinase
MLGQIEASVQAREASELEARASEQRMRQFLDDASHELRTPLTSIRGFSELHRKQVDASLDDRERLVGRIESEANRMGGLLEDMLLLARLDQDRPMTHDPVDLVPLAADAVFDLHTLDPDRPVQLELPHADDSSVDRVGVVVLGDEGRLRQVVANLVRNARVHTPPDTPIHVRVGVDQSGEWGVLEVADDGPGLAPQDAARVFERFYRADRARARTTGGSGLGLPIVSSITHAHHGHVALDTAPGEGARFTLTLPSA